MSNRLERRHSLRGLNKRAQPTPALLATLNAARTALHHTGRRNMVPALLLGKIDRTGNPLLRVGVKRPTDIALDVKREITAYPARDNTRGRAIRRAGGVLQEEVAGDKAIHVRKDGLHAVRSIDSV